MARRLAIAPHLTAAELEQRYRQAGNPVARSQWQIVWLLAGGMATVEVAHVTGYSVRWVQEIARRYRVGPAANGDRRQGNPGAAPLLDIAQQEALRQALAGPAPDGGLWTCHKVAAWIREAIGRSVDPARGGEWVRRLGFTPQLPRPWATRADPAAHVERHYACLLAVCLRLWPPQQWTELVVSAAARHDRVVQWPLSHQVS